MSYVQYSLSHLHQYLTGTSVATIEQLMEILLLPASGHTDGYQCDQIARMFV